MRKTVEASEREYHLCVFSVHSSLYLQYIHSPHDTQVRMGNIINERNAVTNAVRYKRYNFASNTKGEIKKERGEKKRKMS